MKLYILAVYDAQVGAYSTPFFQVSVNHAIRSFINEAKRQASDNPMYTNPQDFNLYLLGEIETNTGKISPILPQEVASAIQLINTEK